MKEKIAVLTSGGDAPGMNAALSAIYLACVNKNCELVFIHNGYKGLCEDDFTLATSQSISRISDQPGTIIGSARYLNMQQKDYLGIAVSNLTKHNINKLIVIGGNGSYLGAQSLSETSISCIALPATIDNDIQGTQFALGFDSCVNEIVKSIDNLRFTIDSHNRIIIVEVMGRNCAQIAYYAQLATNCEIFVPSDKRISEEAIIEKVKYYQTNKLTSIIILVSEKLYDVHQLAQRIESESGIITRSMILGFLQRGPRPSAYDRKMANMMGVMAVSEILQSKSGSIAWINNAPILKSIDDSLSIPSYDNEMYWFYLDLLKK